MLNKALLSLAVSLCVLASPARSQTASAPAPGRGMEAAPEPRPGSPSAAPAAGAASPNQTAAAKGDPNSQPPPEPSGPFGISYNGWFLGLMVGVIVLMFVLNSRTRRKQEAKRKELLNSMKKGDRVQTIGGIIGTLIEVRDTEVVVKVDEQNSTRLRFLRSAIAHVGEPQGDREQQKKD